VSGGPPGLFDDIPVIGRRSPADAAKVLREVGEAEVADRLERLPERTVRSFGLGGLIDDMFGPRLWSYSTHAFGYIAPHPPGAKAPLPILHAGNLKPDTSLRGQRVKITLNWLRVADYPGRGMHRILFDFYARNQTTGSDADLHFNSTYRVREGQQAGIIGYPIFIGVNVGDEGLAFRCYTVNVKNDADETFLDFLESDSFKQGLEITKTVQPAIKPFAEMAYGLTRARLAEGAYIAAQIRDSLYSVWDWQDWVYDPSSGSIVARDDRRAALPYNYFVFGISRMT
jgi:hypothetical protein